MAGVGQSRDGRPLLAVSLWVVTPGSPSADLLYLVQLTRRMEVATAVRLPVRGDPLSRVQWVTPSSGRRRRARA